MNSVYNKYFILNVFSKESITLLILSLLFSFLPYSLYAQNKTGNIVVYDVSFLRTMFPNVDYNDAVAAIKVYMDELQRDLIRGYEMKAVMFDNTDDLIKSYSKYNLADVTLNTVDFITYRSKLSLLPVLVSSGKTSPYEEYYILVKNESNIHNLTDLAGKDLGIMRKGNNPIPLMWLEVLLGKNKIYNIDKYFDKIVDGKSESQLIMSVFFNQLSSCVVSKSSFETIIELNPQIEKQLKIIKVSPGYLLSVSSFTKNFMNTSYSKSLLDKLLYLDSYPAGKQLFTLTKTEKLIRFKEDYLISVKQLMEEYNKIPKPRKK